MVLIRITLFICASFLGYVIASGAVAPRGNLQKSRGDCFGARTPPRNDGLKQNPFIHIRDEGSFDYAQDSPRYHPNSVEGLKVTRCKLHHSTLDLPTFKRSLFAITGSPADDYFVSPSKSLFRDNRRVQSFMMLPFAPVKGFHLAFPSR